MNPLHEAARGAWDRKSLWAIQGVGNLAALGLLWVWLSLPDASGAQLAASFALGLALVCGWLWLQGTTLAAYRAGAGVPWGATLKRLPTLLLWAVLLGFVLLAIPRWCPPALRGGAVALALLVWIPLASQFAAHGFQLHGLQRCFLGWRYYAGFAVAAALGVWAPAQLIAWVPKLEGLLLQAVSMAVRFLLAYVLAVGCWLMLGALIGKLADTGAAAGRTAVS